jgi:hypothetical protein
MAANNQTEEQLASTNYVQAYGHINRNELWNKRRGHQIHLTHAIQELHTK